MMRLSTLLNGFFSLPAKADRPISHLILDSRKVGAHSLFFAVRGHHLDGLTYIAEAIKKGAVAILVDALKTDETMTWQQDVPLIPIYQLQQHIGALAARFYNEPAEKLSVIGVTGTSGKTSCTHFIAQLLHALHTPSGLIGTLGSGLYGALRETGLTTPDAITLQGALQQFVEQGVKVVAMEVSSHSIDQGRVNGIPFEIGIFTNLSQDHLDYHGDMATYAAVKRRFLAELPIKHLIINVDDEIGKKWQSELKTHPSLYTYSTRQPASSYTEEVELTLEGIKAEVHTPWGKGPLFLPLVGEFNLSNALAALTALCLYGFPFTEVLKALRTLKTVPGRMQMLSGPGKPLVVVDYAHKPDALQKVLQALRPHVTGKLLCVFGCGGERDREKRPLMARIAEQFADRLIVTNDNPRHEKPEAIAAEIMRGFSFPERVEIELDRSKAIENSIQWAEPSDCILIAGKGAEHYQQFGDTKIPFDDVNEATKYLLSKDLAD